MAYEISSSDADQLVLKLKPSGCTTPFMLGIGAFFLGLGIFFQIVDSIVESEGLIAWGLRVPLVVGVAIMVAAFYVPAMANQGLPDKVVFDHRMGVLITETGKESNKPYSVKLKGYIRYDEIEGFDTHAEVTSYMGGVGDSGSASVSYHVILRRKNGSEWSISTGHTLPEAEEIANKLREQVPLGNPTTFSYQPTLSSKISREEGHDKTVIHWQNKVHAGHTAFLVAFGTIALVVFMVLFIKTYGSVIFFGGTLFLFLIFMAVIGGNGWKIYRDGTRRFAVAVSNSSFDYYEFSKSSGVIKNNVSIALGDVARIVYSHVPGKTEEPEFVIVRTDQVARWEENQKNSLGVLKDAALGNDQPLKLSISALNMVECLQLEAWLKELLKKKGNTIVQ